jgi:hypothetical protein
MIDEARERYQKGITTLTGYLLESIDALGQTSINLGWIAQEMGVDKNVLRNTVYEMRKKGLLDNIPTVDPRSQPKPVLSDD